MTEGIVFKAVSGFYYVDSAVGAVECRARGLFRLNKSTPLVGDRVVFSPTDNGKGYLTSILPRKNEFIRPPIANIDIMVIVATAAAPVTDTFLIDRMTAVAEKNGCESVICINKCDLDPAKKLYEIYNSAGFRTVKTSAETGEGLDELLDIIKDRVSVFTGNSGVGKSSILNSLSPDSHARVGEVSAKLGRGRHTTRHVELFKLPGGAIIADTPGFSAFDTERLAAKEDIKDLFPEFSPFTGKCRFPDCAHINEPECAVLDAMKDGSIQKTRHASYVKIFQLVKEFKTWEHKSI